MTKKHMSKREEQILKGSLILLAVLILGMVMIGGVTRLTGSGLSIVEWKPVVGILPPLSAHEWALEFAKYKASPEFQKINFAMSLSEFKEIFWFEYIHRLWGRALGLVLLIPTILVIFRHQERKMWPLIVALWGLGGLQGLMGWWMVKSGLISDPYVSPYRLAAHLLLGFAIFGVALWATFLAFYKREGPPRHVSCGCLKGLILGALGFVIVTVLYGALVAGHKAGLIYNTFPLMGGRVVPFEFLTQDPWWRDLFENPVSVQFMHRVLAIWTFGFCSFIVFYRKKLTLPQSQEYVILGLMYLVFVQVLLGIATLLTEVSIPWAVLHQGWAFLLFGNLLLALFLTLEMEREK